ncbi:membrane protein [Hymenobacter cavernae]|uniref:Membrane protein n=1 Tax=Hymenobacter cavernae TaxID=2044852 RepID=A0ABQ1TZ27_9BACT|nr:membrane protein [Hymenobacter cavernae]
MKQLLLCLMSLLYIATGINHFVHPSFYEAIMPSWMPWHGGLVLLSGVCEVFLGLFLLPIATRRLAASLIILMLIVFLPVHIQTLIDAWHNQSAYLWVHVLRIPLQFVLIWWAKQYTRQTGVFYVSSPVVEA